MTQAGPLRWRTGAGWLVLAGGGRWERDEMEEIDAAVLGWASTGRPIAVLLVAGASAAEGEALLERYADLGGPTGYIVSIFDRRDAHLVENSHLLAQAGLIHITGGPDALSLVRALRGSPALEALAQAFGDGASIAALGTAATALGAWVPAHEAAARSERGWGWVENVAIEANFSGTASATHLRDLLRAHPGCLGLGIPRGTALALGPDARVETVGQGRVTVVLGELMPGPTEVLSTV